jgi:hypothetical protein
MCLSKHVLNCEQNFSFSIFWSWLSDIRFNCNWISDGVLYMDLFSYIFNTSGYVPRILVWSVTIKFQRMWMQAVVAWFEALTRTNETYIKPLSGQQVSGLRFEFQTSLIQSRIANQFRPLGNY